LHILQEISKKRSTNAVAGGLVGFCCKHDIYALGH